MTDRFEIHNTDSLLFMKEIDDVIPGFPLPK